MKNRSVFTLLCLLCFFNNAGAVIRTKYNFNLDWKYSRGTDSTARNVAFDDSGWKPVHLPSSLMDKTEASPSANPTEQVIWYRKNFSVPSEYKDQKVFIEFEGSGEKTEIWVNGQKVGQKENGALAFGFDLSKYVKAGVKKDNLVAVRVTGKRNARLSGNVYLHLTDRLYQTLPLYSSLKSSGVYVYADKYDVRGKRAVLHVESEVRNDYDAPKTMKLNVMVRDNDKLLVREFQSEELTLQPGETKVVSATASMKNLLFWSWGYGYLYEVNTTLTVGNKVVDMVRTRTGFRKTDVRNGVFRLNDRALQLKGYAQNSANEWPGVGSSVPAWLSDYNNRLMLEGNANLVRWTHATPWKQDVESCDRIGLFQTMPAIAPYQNSDKTNWEQQKEIMRDAIVANRNNPSIVFYECSDRTLTEAQLAEMLDIRKEFDPNGGRFVGGPDLMGSETAEYSGDTLNVCKSAGKVVWNMGFACKADGSDQELFALENVARWAGFWQERPGAGRRVSSGAASSVFSDPVSVTGQNQGKVDALRIKKEAWWANQTMWDGWVDPENYHTRILGHWNLQPGTKKDVHVVSNGDQVELFLNGRSLGMGVQTDRFLFTFRNVDYQPGSLRAISYDKAKQPLSESECKTSGAAKSLKLNLIQGQDGLHADGTDLILVEVEIRDANKQRCPAVANPVNLEIDGPVEFVGETNRSKQLVTADGLCRVLLRSTRVSGLVKVIAKTGDLNSDTLLITAQAIDDVKGLSTYLSNAKQPSVLVRGETPATNSFVVSRVPVSVTDIKAGSNLSDGVFSVDDQEQTEWASSAGRSYAWIEYELARESELSEISLMLPDWLNSRYPIRVLNDNGVVLWEGTTNTSYGYVTLMLKKVTISKSVRVELLPVGNEKGIEPALTSSGRTIQKVQPQVKSNDGGTLRIKEIEFFESAE